MKIFLTEFQYDGKTFEGPTILASSFEEAEKQAKNYDVTVVGLLDTVVITGEEDKWNRVLH
jgi:hypothetical protein|tara:strand:- start:1931 stop:2113 length:183 start_codon:yes stop_codon:yes gene_type:complete